MKIIFAIVLTFSVVMAAVDPRSRWCQARCESLHEMDCPDEDQCPEIDSQGELGSEEDKNKENSVCVSPCEALKDSCTSSCWDAYDVCNVGWETSLVKDQDGDCFLTCFEKQFEQLQQAPAR